MNKTQVLSNLKRHWHLLLYPIFFLAASPIMEALNHPIGQVRDLAINLDDLIPFVPQFVLIYHSWMPSLLLLAVGFLLFAIKKNEKSGNLRQSADILFYRRYCLALIFGQAYAHLTFPFFQTFVTRHPFDQAPVNIFEQLVSLTYKVDNPYCGFPSIHVLTSCLAIFFVMRSSFKKIYRYLIALHFSLIIASTLLIKQHVFWDLPGGLLYAILGYLSLPFAEKLADRVEMLFTRRRKPS
ncbi:MAG: phosphatase PAP2 family protein [Eubacteriales bacterium]|nr:phosphatase PAP2 family protein [Eubacteriales bacterium]